MDKPDCPQNQRGKGTDKGLNGCPRSRLSTLRRTEVVTGAGACLQLGAVQYLHLNLVMSTPIGSGEAVAERVLRG